MLPEFNPPPRKQTPTTDRFWPAAALRNWSLSTERKEVGTFKAHPPTTQQPPASIATSSNRPDDASRSTEVAIQSRAILSFAKA